MGLETCGLNLNTAQKELKPHGTADFPCAGYLEQHTNRPEDIIPWHWHDELEIIYVASGTLRVQIPAMTYSLSAGNCLVINSGVLHSAAAEPQCELHSLVFSSQLITGSGDSVFAKKYLSPLTSLSAFRAYRFDRETDESAIKNFVDAFDALEQDAPGFEFTVREKLSFLCFTLYLKFEDSIVTGGFALNQDNLRIRRMLDFIRDNYAGDIALGEIAKAADIGERECLRCFQRTIQLSPMQYLLKYRIMQGAELLLNRPADSVSEISAACGFDSPSNFSKMFRRFYNCTPRDYRKLI